MKSHYHQHFIPRPTIKRQLVLWTPTAVINGGTTLTAALDYQPPIPSPTSQHHYHTTISFAFRLFDQFVLLKGWN